MESSLRRCFHRVATNLCCDERQRTCIQFDKGKFKIQGNPAVSHTGKGKIVLSLKSITGNKAGKWLWIGLAALAAIQLYFVRELLAALLLFTILFAIVAFVAVVLYVIDQAGQR